MTTNMPGAMIDVPQPPWTYDLEIALFKAIVTYRPIGIHRSLRLVTILNAVNSQIPSSDSPLTLQDIKSKLGELYNMEGLEEQEESEDTTEEDPKQTQTEFEFPFEEVVGIIEDRGRGVEGDCSVPNSPEAVMSVRSGGSGRGRGTKRRREESTAISITDAGSDEEGTKSYYDETDGTVTSPTGLTRTKRPRNTTTQIKASASATPAVSTAPKRGRARRGKQKEAKEESSEEEVDEEEAQEEGAEEEEVVDTESVAETTSVAGTDAPAKALRTSSRRKGAADESQAVAKGKAARARGGAARGGRTRARAKGGRAR